MNKVISKMKPRIYRTLLIIITVALINCCSNSSDSIIDITLEENLIRNSSFEFKGVQSLEGWYVEDTDRVGFSDDVPEGGGEWSVGIEPGLVPESYTISYLIAAPEGTHSYRFSFWAKRESISSVARLWVKKPDINLILRVIGISSSYWVQYSTLVTMDTQSGDTIIVQLDGGSTEVSTGSTKYDLVKLIKLD